MMMMTKLKSDKPREKVGKEAREENSMFKPTERNCVVRCHNVKNDKEASEVREGKFCRMCWGR